MREKFRSWKTEEWVLTDLADQEEARKEHGFYLRPNSPRVKSQRLRASLQAEVEVELEAAGGGVGGCSKSVQEEINAPEPLLTPCSSPSQLRQKSELFPADWGTPGPSEHERLTQNKRSVHNTAVLFSRLVRKMLAAGRFSMAGNWESPFHRTR